MTDKNNINFKYVDITDLWLKNNKTNYFKIIDSKYYIFNGIKYYVDGKYVVMDYSDNEKKVAIWLGKCFGGTIYMLPRINYPYGIMTADYLFKNELRDLKTIVGSGKRVIEDAIKRKKMQSKNFIFDITNSNINKVDLFSQLTKIYNSKTTDWVDKVIVKDRENVLVIFKKRPAATLRVTTSQM